MRAFHNDMKIKNKYLRRVRKHRAADQIIKGQYWEDGKGCAVGCTIHGSQHASYETEIGIPEWLARLEDTIFEGLPNKRAKDWPVEFLAAIKVGVDLDPVKKPFLIFILEQNLTYLDACKFDADKFPDVKKAIDGSRAAIIQMTEAQRSNDQDKIQAARSAAWSARSAAWSAESAAAWSAESAARSAAESAESAARSAAWSAESAAWSARSAAESAAETYVKYADKLLELIRECR